MDILAVCSPLSFQPGKGLAFAQMRSSEPLWDSSDELRWERHLSASCLLGGGYILLPTAWLCGQSRRAGGQHKKMQREDWFGDTQGFLNEAASGCFSVPAAYQSMPLLPNVVGVEFLPPEKSRLIKGLFRLRLEYLTHSCLAPKAILFLRK